MNRIGETTTFLNMLQRKLINEKQNISQHQDFIIIPTSYPYLKFTQWDAILCKEKYLFYNI